MVKKVLINHSNHPSQGWHDSQKAGWDEIIDVEFPNIPPDMSTEQVMQVVLQNYKKIISIVKSLEEKGKVYLMLQGEFTYSFLLYGMARYDVSIVIPTTQRVSVELGDGKKISQFQFVRWRVLHDSEG